MENCSDGSIINITVYNVTGSTEIAPTKPAGLQITYRILIPLILAAIMLSMGCGINFRDVKAHLVRPYGPLVGLLCQFLIMPAIAFGLAHALSLLPHHAIGMVIVSSCPGGTISNIFAFWSRGDLPLSICMTLLSSVLALGFMPLNMFIYMRSWTDQKVQIPFVQIVVIIVLTWIPVGLGMVIKHKVERLARYVIMLGSVAGFVLILAAGAIQGQLYPEFFALSWNVWFGAFALPLIGYSVGFGLATIAYLKLYMRRTVAIETGIQNTGLALTLIAVSFESTRSNMFNQYPLLYAAAQTVLGITITLSHIIYFYFTRDKSEKGCGSFLKAWRNDGEEGGEDDDRLCKGDPNEKLYTVEIITSFDGPPISDKILNNMPSDNDLPKKTMSEYMEQF